jgi:nucleoside-diphosphate-sugar epimerase
MNHDIKNLGNILITGGTGFVGSYLTKRLVDEGATVRVFDNNSRGSTKRLDDYIDRVEFVEGDIRNYHQVLEATRGIDTVFHLAYINGTENFYKVPEVVLDVGVKGAIHTIDAALECGVKNYIVTSSSEVYQEPTHIPTNEEERIIIPDIKNPRFSYSGGKIITELMTIHCTAKTDLKTVICRPHNFYGANMGQSHVIAEFIMLMKEISNNFTKKEIDFPIQGTGKETRSFCYIDDAIDALILCTIKGKDQEVYHLGTQSEISIENLAKLISDELGIRINIKQGRLKAGGTTRRCPDITKTRLLGFEPRVSLREGIKKMIDWYTDDANIQTDHNKEGIRK